MTIKYIEIPQRERSIYEEAPVKVLDAVYKTDQIGVEVSGGRATALNYESQWDAYSIICNEG